MIVEISREQADEMIARISKFIVNRKMAAPAIITIESLRPLSRIGSQLLHFLAPFAEIIFNAEEYQKFAILLEDQENIKKLVQKIDEIDSEMFQKERKQKKLLRKRRNNKIKNFFKFRKKK